MDFHQTWCVHWYCGDLVWDCWWANFVSFQQSYLPVAHLYFHFWTITSKYRWIFAKLGMCIEIMEIHFGIANGQIPSIFHSYLPAIHQYFTFRTITWVNQWIFTKFDMCIYIVEICFGIALLRILSNFDRVVCPGHHGNGGVLSFHVLLIFFFFKTKKFQGI